MKQIEITVRLNENMQSAIRKLEKQGFKKIRESQIDDVYMTAKLKELNKDNIQTILKKSVLLRSLKLENKEIKKITYKNKEIDKDGDIISLSRSDSLSPKIVNVSVSPSISYTTFEPGITFEPSNDL